MKEKEASNRPSPCAVPSIRLRRMRPLLNSKPPSGKKNRNKVRAMKKEKEASTPLSLSWRVPSIRLRRMRPLPSSKPPRGRRIGTRLGR